MKLSKVIIHNFCSFKDTSVSFSDELFYLVLGNNLDSDKVDSNGSGKSSFFEAISYLLFKKVIKKSSEVLRKGTEYGYIEGYFIHDGVDLIICREFGKKRGSDRSELALQSSFGSNSLFIFRDGVELTKKTDTESQLELFQLLGINSNFAFDLFCNTVYLSSNSSNSFILGNMGPSAQFVFISKLLGLEKFDLGLSNALSDSKKLQHSKIQLESLISSLNEQLQNIENSLVSLQSVKSDLNECISQISDAESARAEFADFFSLQSVITSKQSERFEIAKSMEIEIGNLKQRFNSIRSKLRESLAAVERRNILESKLGLSEGDLVKQPQLLSELEKAQIEFSKFEKEYTELSKKEFYTCPNCSSNLSLVDHSLVLADDVTSIQARIADLKIKIEQLRTRKLNLHKDLESISKSIRQRDLDLIELQSCLTLVNMLDDTTVELEKVKNLGKSTEDKYVKKLEIIDTELASLEVKLTSFDTLKLKDIDNNLHNLKQKLDLLNQQMGQFKYLTSQKASLSSQLTAELDNLKKLNLNLENSLIWVEGFPVLKRWTVDEFLPRLSELINRYLNIGFQVSLSTLKDLKTRDEKKVQFTIQVFDGKVVRELNSFSSGERARVALAVSMAFREVLSNIFNNPFEWMMIDEIFDSLDLSGIVEFEQLLRDIPITKFVISHNEKIKESLDIEGILVITKNNGISLAQLSS